MTTISASVAQAVIEAVIAQAAAQALTVSVALVDPSGYLVASLRMDGAGFLTPQIAESKAFTAAAWGLPSAIVAERARAAPETFQAFVDIGRTKIVPGKGGLPLRIGGRMAGALGVSGASADQDASLAAIGETAFAALAVPSRPRQQAATMKEDQ